MKTLTEENRRPAGLAEVLITNELQTRPTRPPDLKAENEALRQVAQQLAREANSVLQTLVDVALRLCGAGSAGLSLLETGPGDTRIFRWTHLAGKLAYCVGATTPRDLSPCGTCLDRMAPQLYSHPARYFTCFNKVTVPIVEGLVVPVCDETGTLGTIWLLAHDEKRKFDTEDVRIMTSFADFTASALRTQRLCASEREARERAAKEMHQHANQLEKRVAERTFELEETNRFLESFCYSIAHDLKAPLRATRSFTQILLSEHASGFDDVGKDYARRIVAATSRMEKLIQDLLDYGRVAQGEFSCGPVDLDQHLTGLLAVLADELKAKDARVETERPFPMVEANGAIIEQVLTNLIRNALKFVAPAVAPRIRIWSEKTDATVRLWVGDNGIGIDPQHHQRIFEPFERLHDAKAYPGTGIGLAIVKKGCERMRGRVGLESGAGEGSRFWIDLPAAKKPAAPI